MFPKESPLARIHIPQTDVDQFLGADPLVFPNPPEDILTILLGETGQECDWHAVDVPARRYFRRVDVRMRIHPDDSQLTTVQSFPDRLGRAGDRSDREGMVTAQRQDTSPLGSVLVDLLADAPCRRADRQRSLHPTIIRIMLGHDLSVRVDGIVMVECVTQVVPELGQEARCDQGGGSSIHARFALWSEVFRVTRFVHGSIDLGYTHLSSRKSYGDNAKVIWTT